MIGTKRKPGRRKGLVVQARDRDILAQACLMRLATRDQLMRAAGFGSITRINARLLALHQAGLLRRFFIGFGAGRKAVYSLSARGAQLIGAKAHGPRTKQDELLAADFSILHQLTINEVYCDIRFPPVPEPDVQVAHWASFSEPITAGLRLIPDGYIEFAAPSGTEAAFLEVDLGTEELKVWKEKARQYLAFAMSGDFARIFHHFRFRVLVLVNSPRRLQYIRAAVAEITQKIFWFAVLDDVRGGGFLNPVWLRPEGTLRKSLFEQSQ